ncbi:MAG: hypothetical protein LLG45_13130 [Actinomycetia bacterium]|nr:hypothetical protein [Actinomycetes bacterium]
MIKDLTAFGFEIPPSDRPPIKFRPYVPDFDPYYALIELPSRRHIPYPMVKECVTNSAPDGWRRWAQLRRRMTVSSRVRDERFFYCGKCTEASALGGGWSYFRCREHRPMSEAEDLDKWHELQLILEDDRPEALEIVRAYDRRPWR